MTKTGSDDWKTPLGYYERAIAEITSLREEFKAEIQALKKLQAENTSLKSELRSAQLEIENLNEAFQASQSELKIIQVELQTTKKDLQDTKRQLETTNELIETLAKEYQNTANFVISEAKNAQNKADNALAEIASLKNIKVVTVHPVEKKLEPDKFSSNPTGEVIMILNNIAGMTMAHPRDFEKSRPIFVLKDKTVVRTWKNPVGVEHIFLADSNGKMVYGGFVGWVHSENLRITLEEIRQTFT